MRKYILALIAIIIALNLNLSLKAQVVDNTLNTCASGTNYNLCNVDNFGFTIGPNVSQGQSEMLKDKGVGDRAYMGQPYFQYTFYCGSGTQSTTSWEIDGYNSNYMPANFMQGASYRAYSGSTGASLGTGTISSHTQGQTANMVLSLSSALSAACSHSNSDQIIVSLTSPTQIIPPSTLNGGLPSTATWDSDAPTGFANSIDLQSGNQWAAYVEQVIAPPMDNSVGNRAYTFINGSYTESFWAKCSGCTINYSTYRNSNTFVSGSVNPTSTWTQYTFNFTGNETAATQAQYPVIVNLACSSGPCKVQGNTLIEGSTLSGNTSAFRDNIVLQIRKSGSDMLRAMNPARWGATMLQFLTDDKYRLPMGFPNFPQYSNYTSTLVEDESLKDILDLAVQENKSLYVALPSLLTASDVTLLMNFLGDTNCSDSGAALRCSQGRTAPYLPTFATNNKVIVLELGNEAWNYGANDDLNGGNGKIYGGVMSPVVAAIKASSYYSSSTIKIATNATPTSGGGQFAYNSLTVMGCATGSTSNCPDYEERAPYEFSELYNMTNVTQDGHADQYNLNAAPFTYNPGACATNYQTVASNQFAAPYDAACFGGVVSPSVYEYNYAPYQLSGTYTQTQGSQCCDSAGQALVLSEGAQLMRQYAHITTPINIFAFDDFIAHGASGLNFGNWESQMLMPCGPGQISTCQDYSTPEFIAFRMINNAIEGKKQLLTPSFTGVPTLNYPGGQYNGSTDKVIAAPNLPLTNIFTYNQAGTNNYAKVIYNDDTVSHTFTLNAPTGPLSSTSVSYYTFGGPTNSVNDNCDLVNLSTINTPCSVIMPTVQVGTGMNSVSVAANSMLVMYYNNAGTSQAATPTFSPGAGTYGPAQNITISDTTSGANIFYATSSCPITSGGTAYTAPVAISTSTTLCAYATASGYTQSATGSAAYVINGAAAAPTFSPAAGTYPSAQVVTIASTTPGAIITYCIGVGCNPTTMYTGPIAVNSSESITAFAGATGYTNSSNVTAAYVIQNCTNKVILSNSELVTALAGTPVKVPVVCTYP